MSETVQGRRDPEMLLPCPIHCMHVENRGHIRRATLGLGGRDKSHGGKGSGRDRPSGRMARSPSGLGQEKQRLKAEATGSVGGQAQGSTWDRHSRMLSWPLGLSQRRGLQPAFRVGKGVGDKTRASSPCSPCHSSAVPAQPSPSWCPAPEEVIANEVAAQQGSVRGHKHRAHPHDEATLPAGVGFPPF